MNANGEDGKTLTIFNRLKLFCFIQATIGFSILFIFFLLGRGAYYHHIFYCLFVHYSLYGQQCVLLNILLQSFPPFTAITDRLLSTPLVFLEHGGNKWSHADVGWGGLAGNKHCNLSKVGLMMLKSGHCACYFHTYIWKKCVTLSNFVHKALVMLNQIWDL